MFNKSCKIFDKYDIIMYHKYSYKMWWQEMAKFKIDKEKLNAKSINRTIRIKPEVYDQLSEISKNTGVSFNKVINECIEYALSHM